jgi:hypothetical protein
LVDDHDFLSVLDLNFFCTPLIRMHFFGEPLCDAAQGPIGTELSYELQAERRSVLRRP